VKRDILFSYKSAIESFIVLAIAGLYNCVKKKAGVKMNKIVLLTLCLTVFTALSFAAVKIQGDSRSSTALLLIDIQYFYFPGAKQPLSHPEEASLNARKLLTHYRETNQPVIHVRHNAKTGGEIHENVAPLDSEKVITKNFVNSFRETDLLSFLREHEIQHLVICGMMTHMCVEAAVRAAADYGFDVTLVEDACATRALQYGEATVSAEEVHASTLASLSGYYARVTDTETFLNEVNKK